MLSFVRPTRTILHEHESAVNGDLAITPARMAELTQAGRSVSMGNLENVMYFDANVDKTIGDMPIDHRRGIDFISVWEASRDSRDKLKAFQRASKHAKHMDDIKSKM